MWKLLRRRFRYYLQFVPITLNTVLFGAAIWLLYYYTYKTKPVQKADAAKDSADFSFANFEPFIRLMGKIAFFVVLLLIALRSPVRPNPIASSLVDLVAVEGTTVRVRGLDCLDGTPLIDLKPERTATHRHGGKHR